MSGGHKTVLKKSGSDPKKCGSSPRSKVLGVRCTDPTNPSGPIPNSEDSVNSENLRSWCCCESIILGLSEKHFLHLLP